MKKEDIKAAVGRDDKNKEIFFYRGNAFYSRLRKACSAFLPNSYCLAAIDLEHFRLFNKLYGRKSGDNLILDILDILCRETAGSGGLTGYMGADNFAVLLPDREESLCRIRDGINGALRERSCTVGFSPIFGVYTIDDPALEPEIIYDRATTALKTARAARRTGFCRYTPEMEENLEHEVNLLREIQAGMENDEFVFFAQPQCNITNGRIVGAEALARWRKQDGTVISPGVFIPILEKNGMIDALDRQIWEKVCAWLRKWIDCGYEPVPISINISRIDILSMDVPEYLSNLLDKYRLSEKHIKVEITESAYTENNSRIPLTVNALRSRGFLVMMDDFGAGYSSLNMLKNIPVDVLKLDMRFLDINENVEEKGINILESVVNMARLLRLPIVVEGVETEAQEKYVQSLGCRYTQGFYYFRPLPVDEFERLLLDDRRLDHTGLQYKQVEALHLREFLDSSFISDGMLNNVMGPVAFYEMEGSQLRITRVNEQYLRLIGGENGQNSSYGMRFWNHVRDDDRPALYLIFKSALESHSDEGAQGNIHVLKMDGSCIVVHLRVFFLREKDGICQFYSSLTDVTEFCGTGSTATLPGEAGPDIASVQAPVSSVLQAYDAIPEAVAVLRVIPGHGDVPHDFEIVYCNPALTSLFRGTKEQIKQMSVDALDFGESGTHARETLYRAAYPGEISTVTLYSQISNRYLEFHVFRHDTGYAAAIIRDITNSYVSSNAFQSIALFYREIYFLQLQDNYYRMLYPDSGRVNERGDYAEAINRHFFTGLIDPANETRVREFLLPENLLKALAHSDKVEMPYRRRHEGQKEWCLTSITVSERDKNGRAKNALMVIRSIDTLFRRTENKRTKYLSEALEGMSDAFFIYEGAGEERLLYANRGAAQIFGCDSVEEFRSYVHNSFKGMVHPDDLERIETELHDQICQSVHNMDYISYRITRRDGSVRWVDDVGHYESDASGGNGIFYVFISDVTDTMPEAQKNRLMLRNQYYQKEN